MKQLLFISALLLTLVSCQSNYIRVMDTSNGQFILLRDVSRITELQDTLIIYKNDKLHTSYHVYGKFLKDIPNTGTHTYRKVVRIH